MRFWHAICLALVGIGSVAPDALAVRVVDLWARSVSAPNGGWSSAFPANLADFRTNSACPDGGPPDARCFCECSGCTDPSSSSYQFRHARSQQDDPTEIVRGVTLRDENNHPFAPLGAGEHVVSVRANPLIRFDQNGATPHQFLLVRMRRSDNTTTPELTSDDWSHSRQAGTNQPPFSGTGQLYCNWPLWSSDVGGAEFLPSLSGVSDFASFFASANTAVEVRASQGNPSTVEELRVKAIRVRVTIAQCGDGVVDPGEQCDGGECCEPNCTFSPDRPCTDDGNPCTVDHCNTVSATCSHPPVVAGASCPDDGQPCSNDVCDGAGNCIHPAKAAGTSCRIAGGSCDVAETCDGSGLACPPDAKLPAGTPCPDDGQACSNDVCDGSGTCSHPPKAAGAPCRAAAGPCDVAEACDGSSPACPGDAKQPAGTPCPDDGNSCTSDRCDAGGSCQHAPVGICGDGVVVPGCEECDRGAANCTASGTCCESGCSADCKIVGRCLDGATCCESRAQCGTNVACCGDGTLDPGEECDDGNLRNGDCCSDTCRLETTIDCVPGCAGVSGPQLFSPATMKAKFIDKGGVGTYALWNVNPKGRNGDFNIAFGQAIDPRNEPTRLVVLENNGANGSRILGDFTVHANDWSRCAVTPGTDDETCSLTDPTEMLSDDPGVRSARIKEVGNKVKYRFQGHSKAQILKPTSPGGLVRACIFIGDDAGSATLKCQASSNGRALKCQSLN